MVVVVLVVLVVLVLLVVVLVVLVVVVLLVVLLVLVAVLVLVPAVRWEDGQWWEGVAILTLAHRPTPWRGWGVGGVNA